MADKTGIQTLYAYLNDDPNIGDGPGIAAMFDPQVGWVPPW